MEAEVPVLWPPDAKSQLTGKEPDVGWQRRRWLDSITNSMDMNVSKLREIVEDRGASRAAVHWLVESDTTQQLNDKQQNSHIFKISPTHGRNNIEITRKIIF